MERIIARTSQIMKREYLDKNSKEIAGVKKGGYVVILANNNTGANIHVEGNAQHSTVLARFGKFRKLNFVNAVVSGSKCEAETRVGARRVVGARGEARE